MCVHVWCWAGGNCQKFTAISAARRYHGACAGLTQEDVDALGSADWECPECDSYRCARLLRPKP